MPPTEREEGKDEFLLSEDEESSINAHKELLSSISILNANMIAVSESLKQFHTNVNTAEPAGKRPLLPDKEGPSDPQNGQQSDVDQLLNQQANKRALILPPISEDGSAAILKRKKLRIVRVNFRANSSFDLCIFYRLH